MRILIYILCLLLPLGVLGQTFTQRTNGTFTPVDPFLSIPRSLYIPKSCDTTNGLNGGKDTLGALLFDTCGHKLWIRDGLGTAHRWIEAKGTNICNASLGGSNDGTTDISTYVQSLIDNGCKVIYFPSGTYLFSNTVQMKDSVTIIGEDKSSIIKLTKNIPAFKCGWALGGNKCTFRNISFLGTYPEDSTSQDGIFSDSCNGILTYNISAMKMAGWAIHFKNNGFCCGGYPLPTAVLGNLTSDCFIDSSYGGIFHDTRAEFNSVVNSTVVRGKYGITTSAGSSRIEACNISGTDYGVTITGGSNNAHGTMIGTHIAHSRNLGLYVTGASNGFEIIGSNIRQDSILVENSDNIRFVTCELGALNNAISVVNSTNTIFSFNRVWGSTPFGPISAGTKMLCSDSATNGISIVDLPTGKRFDISQIDGLIDFTGTNIRRIRMSNDTLNFSTNGTQHYIAGGENTNDSLILTSTTNITKGKIKFGTQSTGLTFLENNGNLGLGTTNPTNKIDLRGAGILNINIQPDAGGHSRTTFNVTPSSPTIGAQFLFGDTTSPFTPGGLLVSSISKFLALGCTNGDIRFVKTTTINGTNEHARFTNAGLFGIGVTVPTAIVHIKAGTATANTAPLKLTAGVNLTIPEDGAIEFDGTDYYVTSGSTRYILTKSLTGSATLDFTSTSAQTSTDLTITVTGAVDGDAVVLGIPNGSINANSSFTAWVSAPDTVTVRFNNYSASPIDPASGTFKVKVTK